MCYNRKDILQMQLLKNLGTLYSKVISSSALAPDISGQKKIIISSDLFSSDGMCS